MPLNATQLLGAVQQFKRYYVRRFEGLMERTALTMREMDVVLFLANNPARDTARDVTELRGIVKSQVSAAVELLSRRGLLVRRPDPADRRLVRLTLTEDGAALAEEARRIQAGCLEVLFSGLEAEERSCLQALLEKMIAGAEARLREEAES